MNAILSINGFKTNFYRWPLRTYRDYKRLIDGNKLSEKENALVSRFRLFGILLILSIVLFQFAIIFFPKIEGFHF